MPLVSTSHCLLLKTAVARAAARRWRIGSLRPPVEQADDLEATAQCIPGFPSFGQAHDAPIALGALALTVPKADRTAQQAGLCVPASRASDIESLHGLVESSSAPALSQSSASWPDALRVEIHTTFLASKYLLASLLQ